MYVIFACNSKDYSDWETNMLQAVLFPLMGIEIGMEIIYFSESK